MLRTAVRRLDQAKTKTFGYQTILYDDGKYVTSRFFSDARNGGTLRAFRRARAAAGGMIGGRHRHQGTNGTAPNGKPVVVVQTYNYTVESGVPIPMCRGGGRNQKRKYPFEAMDIGDSFAVTERYQTVAAAASKWGKDHGQTYTTRKTGDTWRVWRTA